MHVVEVRKPEEHGAPEKLDAAARVGHLVAEEARAHAVRHTRRQSSHPIVVAGDAVADIQPCGIGFA